VPLEFLKSAFENIDKYVFRKNIQLANNTYQNQIFNSIVILQCHYNFDHFINIGRNNSPEMEFYWMEIK